MLERRWIAARGSAIFRGSAAVRFIGTVLDISARKRAERRLEVVNRTGAAVAAEHDVDAIVQSITDAGVELTGAEFGAFFYNKADERGESYMLYALSGVAREAFSKFPMPRNTAVFGPTFRGEGVVRSDDIRADPRYGHNMPNSGMPEGHLPVRSYLAVPVVSNSGEVLGGLFFGHQEAAVFKPDHETLLLGLAGQAATAIDNSRLISALQTLNATLEQRVAREVSERTRTEDQLRQSQKMEAIGHLTGGIAHDFNNMLAVVIGALNLLERRLRRGESNVDRYIEAAMDGAMRASALTQRLLAFSRQQPLAPAVLDANELVASMESLLSRTLGEHIQIETVGAGDLWRCFVDRVQLENALLNLAVNGRDAMTGGGTLAIRTANVNADGAFARSRGLTPGPYVEIAVSDTGTGMTAEVMDRAFDPFFTTKPVGKGSGLGLSQVFGFVRQSGGGVSLNSELGAGTTVRLYVPRHDGPDPETRDEDRVEAIPRGDSGTRILVVEDEERVRSFSVEALRELGYGVTEAENAREALALITAGAEVDLLFTDVVMPDMNGRQLAAQALAVRPSLKILFTTGYAPEALTEGGADDETVLPKPFTLEQLAEKIRLTLDRAG